MNTSHGNSTKTLSSINIRPKNTKLQRIKSVQQEILEDTIFSENGENKSIIQFAIENGTADPNSLVNTINNVINERLLRQAEEFKLRKKRIYGNDNGIELGKEEAPNQIVDELIQEYKESLNVINDDDFLYRV